MIYHLNCGRCNPGLMLIHIRSIFTCILTSFNHRLLIVYPGFNHNVWNQELWKTCRAEKGLYRCECTIGFLGWSTDATSLETMPLENDWNSCQVKPKGNDDAALQTVHSDVLTSSEQCDEMFTQTHFRPNSMYYQVCSQAVFATMLTVIWLLVAVRDMFLLYNQLVDVSEHMQCLADEL